MLTCDEQENNYDFFFLKIIGTGSSSSKCSNIYRGPQEFSEIEFQNIRDYVLALDPVPILAECIHSYSQLWLWPYGYDYGSNYPENYEEIVSTNIFFRHLLKLRSMQYFSKGQLISNCPLGVFKSTIKFSAFFFLIQSLLGQK